jgi:1-deoxy-D-xylulose-5-phosphate reductoisomerase
MTDLIEQSMQKITYIKHPNLEDLINTDKETRDFTNTIIKK